MQQHRLKVIISGGGTGGHIFPAIAIAEMLKQKDPGTEILFVGAKGRMEMEKVPDAGFRIEGLWISGLQRRLTLKNLSFPFKLLSSLLEARKIIRQFEPDVAVGTGGYASGPTLRMASAAGIPCLIQEQNSYPGITNRLLAKKAEKICVAYEGMEKYFPAEKIILSGNPVRSDILKPKINRKEASGFFDLDPEKSIVLIVGGSQGARAINDGIKNKLHVFVKNNIQLIWQCGKHSYDEIRQSASEYEGKGIRVLEFIRRMDMAYAAADLVISRAGAIAISELCIAGKACIFVPLPTAAEDHQTKNAISLVKENAALIVKNIEAVNMLAETATALVQNPKRMKELQDNIQKMARPDATHVIAEEVTKLAGGKK